MVFELKKIIDEFEKLEFRYREIKSAFNYNSISDELEELKKITLSKDFWNNPEEAKITLKRISSIENKLNTTFLKELNNINKRTGFLLLFGVAIIVLNVVLIQNLLIN